MLERARYRRPRYYEVSSRLRDRQRRAAHNIEHIVFESNRSRSATTASPRSSRQPHLHRTTRILRVHVNRIVRHRPPRIGDIQALEEAKVGSMRPADEQPEAPIAEVRLAVLRYGAVRIVARVRSD